MSDPIERVAQAICFADGSAEGPDGKLILEKACDCERAEFCYEVGGSLRPEMRGQALAAIEEYARYLTEQGIPIDKLLSGKLEAAPPVVVAAGTRVVFRKPSDGEMEWARKWCEDNADLIKQAQLDYAGGQVVTPESVEQWAERLASDSVEAGEAEYGPDYLSNKKS